MAKYTRIQVATQLAESGILPLFYHPDLNLCKAVVKACYDGGIRALEFTNRGDFAHKVFGKLNQYCLAELPGMMLGIGSVYDAGTTSLYLQLGANFIVSPVLNPDMAKICNRRKVMWSPGCGTLSEISQAEELGAEIVKIFPAPAVGGPGFIKAVKGPQPWSSIMPTGGVAPTRENLTTWFEAGLPALGWARSSSPRIFGEEGLWGIDREGERCSGAGGGDSGGIVKYSWGLPTGQPLRACIPERFISNWGYQPMIHR